MSGETEILAALFAASMGTSGAEAGESEEGLWQHFLARLAAATQAESALLRLFWPGSPVSGWHIGPAWEGPPESVVERMRSGRVYSQVDLPEPGAGEPAGQGEALPLRALRWRLGRGGAGGSGGTPGARVLLALRRRGEDFRAVDGLQLANLTPYLGLAMGGWRQLQQARARAALDRGLAGDLGAGWLLFSPAGQVTALAEGLTERLEAMGLPLRADGRLPLPEPEAAALRLALAKAAEGAALPVLLSRTPRVELMLGREAPAGEPLLVGRVRHALSARALPLAQLCAAFGLSRSEARLAACLCDGLSLSEAAQELGWTLETARSCSKQIFARMGVSGQPGVVRRMLASAVWLGCAGQGG
ncbi:hypothetical protein CEW88_23510 (plasmid) [Alloyangia pacifica]|uniref:HTH luxR-type domain-containing protein n=1 Tax=Alloyangia pacifica TaxID=311180 RepID=A0A2U8HLX9_9RHOB|nr:hypothetical protein [Alloyangia pacifica]AWI86734.1 hypothetical protein CEW88_23510 [Alloyangia pacifica]